MKTNRNIQKVAHMCFESKIIDFSDVIGHKNSKSGDLDFHNCFI